VAAAVFGQDAPVLLSRSSLAMFDNLTQRFEKIVRDLRGRGRLTEENIADALREVRRALLEADVALPVVREFIETVRARALGTEVTGSLTPGQAAIQVVHQSLVELMGAHNAGLDLATRPPAVVLLAGLQGAGKTTTAAKLARLIHEREHRRVLLASLDIYRPAAIEQLATLAGRVGAAFFPTDPTQDPAMIARGSAARTF